MRRSVIIGFGLFALLGVLATFVAYQNTLRTELSKDRAAGAVRLAETTSRLRGQLDVYRTLTNVLAQDPRVGDDTVAEKLSNFSLTYGAWQIDLTDENGRVVASSNEARVGYLHDAALIHAAANGRLGYEVDVEQGERLVRFSRTFSGGGVVVVSAGFGSLEFEWPITPEPVILFNRDDLSISANRSDLLLLSLTKTPGEGGFPLTREADVGGQPTWFFAQGTTAKNAQVVRTDVPLLELTGMIIMDTAPARNTALVRASLTAALVLALGLAGAILMQQRRRLAMESEYSANLEARVQERTQALQQTQTKLMEASNLAALGRLSAGISHELNQPLAAIQTFAENGRTFLSKDRPKDADGNLSLIADQVRRITRIIGNLRAFARRDATQRDVLDLRPVVENTLAMAAPDIAARGADVTMDLPNGPVMVLGGQVRLEQVVLNLVTNALDAMETVPEKRLEIALTVDATRAILTVQDSGTGIEDPSQVFEPFYSTKDLGSSQGLGMGLALSFGIVSQFGGQLSCQNTENGAQFCMTLPLAHSEA